MPEGSGAEQDGLRAVGELCHEASAQRLHDLAKREPLTLSELEAAQQQALGRCTEALQAAVLKAGDAVASACSKALDRLDATMIDFRTKQVRAQRALLQQPHASPESEVRAMVVLTQGMSHMWLCAVFMACVMVMHQHDAEAGACCRTRPKPWAPP